MEKTRKSQSESNFGFQGHFFKPPYSLHRILEDFKSDHITLKEAIAQISDISTKEKAIEETNFKYKDIQSKFDL